MSEDRSVDDIRRTLLALLPAALCASCSKSEAPAATPATAPSPPSAAPAPSADAVQPAAFRVVLENDQVRVLEFNSRPGLGVCGSGMHSHPPHLTVALTPAKVRVTLPDGKKIEAENQVGDVFWSEAETHETENISGKDVRALIVEVRAPKAKA